MQDPDFASKIIPINGDIYEPELGISAKDVKTLEENVSIVYHSAASVRFDDPIRLAVEMNVRLVVILTVILRVILRAILRVI